uniref:Enhancer of mRNA-decapping protein 4 C-terminal domain-containing protein n=1 Tax=Romanomermis culicivorax TaxID=13658 RepID=A0A915HJB4_ROMCU
MSSQADLKLKYLTEAVTSIDIRSIQSPNHQQNVNRVICQLERNLESFASTPASGPFSRQIKILMMAAQSLTK